MIKKCIRQRHRNRPRGSGKQPVNAESSMEACSALCRRDRMALVRLGRRSRRKLLSLGLALREPVWEVSAYTDTYFLVFVLMAFMAHFISSAFFVLETAEARSFSMCLRKA